jgi:hypothetical protein
MKIVVFDLDETLGYFTEFGMFWDSLKKIVKQNLTQNDFNTLLDLYPEFLRPNIINILNYLKTKKESQCCHKMMIYTNNNGPREWVQHIIKYFENKIGVPLIDQIIAAFKINGKQVEICRTTHNKTHQDFIRCTKLPANAEICFLDDIFHPGMANDNVYYINIKPYYHDITFEEMLDRLLASPLKETLDLKDDNFKKIMHEQWKLYKYKCLEKDPKEYDLDKIVGKHIITHLQIFFNDKSKKSKTMKKRRERRKRKTMKEKQ